MKNSLYIIGGLLVSAIAIAFIPTEDEKIQIHLMHHENGKSVMYDTIFDAASGYTVADFITDKGLNPDETDILDMNLVIDNFLDDNPEIDALLSKRVVRSSNFHFADTETIQTKNGESETISIEKTVDENGKVAIEKKVNGEVVEMDPSEMELEMKNGAIFIKEDGKMKVIDIDTDSDGNVFKFEVDGEAEDIDVDALIKSVTEDIDMNGSEVIMIKRVVDQDGNVTTEKTVNGEVVEEDESNGEWITEAEGGNQHVVKIINSTGNQEDGQMYFDIDVEELNDGTGSPQIHTIVKKVDENGKVTITETDGIGDDKEVDVQVFVRSDDEDNSNTEKEVKLMAYEYKVESSSDHSPVFMHSADGNMETFSIAIVTRITEGTESKSKETNETTSDIKLPIENLNFFPNPNDGTLRLNFFLPQRGKTVISVFDMEGKRVYKSNLGNFEGAYDKEIDLTDLETGTYILRITQNNLSLAEKLIVN